MTVQTIEARRSHRMNRLTGEQITFLVRFGEQITFLVR